MNDRDQQNEKERFLASKDIEEDDLEDCMYERPSRRSKKYINTTHYGHWAEGPDGE